MEMKRKFRYRARCSAGWTDAAATGIPQCRHGIIRGRHLSSLTDRLAPSDHLNHPHHVHDGAEQNGHTECQEAARGPMTTQHIIHVPCISLDRARARADQTRCSQTESSAMLASRCAAERSSVKDSSSSRTSTGLHRPQTSQRTVRSPSPSGRPIPHPEQATQRVREKALPTRRDLAKKLGARLEF